MHVNCSQRKTSLSNSILLVKDTQTSRAYQILEKTATKKMKWHYIFRDRNVVFIVIIIIIITLY